MTLKNLQKTILLTLLLVMMPLASAQVPIVNPGITPDNPLWGLDRAWDRTMEVFQGQQRVERNLLERSEEIQVVIERATDESNNLTEGGVVFPDNQLRNIERANRALERNMERYKQLQDTLVDEDIQRYANQSNQLGMDVSTIARGNETGTEKANLILERITQHNERVSQARESLRNQTDEDGEKRFQYINKDTLGVRG